VSRGRKAIPHAPRAPSERSLRFRRQFVLAIWLLSSIIVLFRAVDLQVAQGSEWRHEAERQHRMQGAVPAARGPILDRDGTPLALSHETFRVGVAPHELTHAADVAEVLRAALDLSPAEASRVTSDTRRWVMVPGRFPPSAREELAGVRGVYVERELRRFYPQDDLARGILGGVIDDLGAGGIEQAFESHLRGQPGTEVLARDSEGRPIPGETWLTTAPRSGGAVALTIDAELQEIANEALGEAIEATGARGGDVIVTDPRTGEILAMVSVQDGVDTHLAGINTPYEPGSTLKPFTVASLLRSGKAALSDSVDTGNGQWVVNGRQISDVSVVGTVTLARALQVSSNIGIAKVAQDLTPEEQYEALRDFGFGVPTGVSLPGEVGGTLRRPDQWSRQSAASLAIGYEIAATPIQMAMAYGALANGGVLMEPLLIRELRDDEGRVVEAFAPRPVRRVVPEEVAREINRTLVEAVETGTGTRARLASFEVAGKSGTSRAYGAAGYDQGAYFASFVGFFPADDPQLVVFVKLDRPQGTYYGGATAAPVTRATMEAILAARRSPLDRGALAAIAQAQRAALSDSSVPTVPVPLLAASPAATGNGEVTPVSPAPVEAVPVRLESGVVTVPNLQGLTPRTAARRLHRLGLTVVWESAGMITGSVPEAGSTVLPGDTIRLLPSVAEFVPLLSAEEGDMGDDMPEEEIPDNGRSHGEVTDDD